MSVDSIFHYFNLTLQVFFLDLLLSGDNAMMIALACRSLPPELTKRAMLMGISAAILLRILLTSVASFLLYIPILKLLGGIALTVIALQLIIEEDEEAELGLSPSKTDLWSVVVTIIVADLVMSVDNVVALAAVTQGNFLFLCLGLLLSVPLLMFGSLFVSSLLTQYPLLIRGGGAMLGWLAGDIAIGDPLIADWVNQQAPALTVVVPILVMVFVLLESRIMEEMQASASALRPKPWQASDTTVIDPVAEQIAEAQIVEQSIVEPLMVMSQWVETKRVEPASVAYEPSNVSPDSWRTLLQNRRSWFRGYWIPVAALIIAVVFGCAIFLVDHLKPKPAGLGRYLCTGRDASFFYRNGANIVRMTSTAGMVTGYLNNGKIVWDGGYAAATKTLGFAPPTEVKYSDTQSVRVSSGHADEINCVVQPGA